MRRTAALSLLVVFAALLLSDVDLHRNKASATTPPDLRDVMLVGNNWAGTATIVDANTLKLLKTGVDFIPDKAQEIADIQKSPDRLAYYYLIQQGPGEGH